jgi:hypothetical protein
MEIGLLKVASENISMKGPWNCRSLGSPGFPVESCGFEQLHVVLFRENHISSAGERCEVGNPGTLGMTKGRGDASIESSYWREGVFTTWVDRRLCVRTEKKPQISPLRDKLTGGVKPRDLIRVHFFADLKHEMSGCFFEICSRLGDTIDLGKEGGLIERLCVTEGFHL